jgi:hypothetical protein
MGYSHPEFPPTTCIKLLKPQAESLNKPANQRQTKEHRDDALATEFSFGLLFLGEVRKLQQYDESAEVSC